ncbi:hypothetical protein SERLADRAFT_413266 [Serpula lacrymans var. lacrymans S7.9]|uniref:F-box domain-containing protein n=1 Tax=Serpula lacrymans var. lacrymans (strain S7.9) TaxID=578457 RepID=F8NJJ6_SERL9|nr:uncharacterized protein SERLADRAFT_413266 [Serpula lacrymans var. lacrymans S7.9]EGO30046.1 hypothetical protein SERLADRAFT_413266 [Serpula lacrymans var. lacrymans S7.9]
MPHNDDHDYKKQRGSKLQWAFTVLSHLPTEQAYTCLLIREIQSNIFAQEVDSEPHSFHPTIDSRKLPKTQHMLSALAQTCRSFSDLALDVLYGELDDFSPLVRCLPKDLVGEVYGKLTFLRLMCPTDWDIFLKYAGRVKRLELHDCHSGVGALTLIMAGFGPMKPLPFPKLKYLGVFFRIRAWQHVLRPFLGPQLLGLKLEFLLEAKDKNRSLAFFNSLNATCPALTSIHLKPSQSDASGHAARSLLNVLMNVICGWDHLKEISFRVFPNGRFELHVLQRLLSTLDSFASSRDTIEGLCIVENAAWDTYHDRIQETVINFGILKVLPTFHRLREIKIDTSFPISMDDETLKEVVTAWPKLQKLSLNAKHGCRGHSKVTTNGFVTLLRLCPELEELGLVIVVEGISPKFPLSMQGPLNSKLTELQLGDSKIGATDYVYFAVIISIVLPRVRSIFSWFSIRGLEEGHEQRTRWIDVLSLLSIFADIKEPGEKILRKSLAGGIVPEAVVSNCKVQLFPDHWFNRKDIYLSAAWSFFFVLLSMLRPVFCILYHDNLALIPSTSQDHNLLAVWQQTLRVNQDEKEHNTWY